ncbi:Ig-like domain-containing protein [Demequina sp.]|uniref:Ig-like domain-containing protein n=1 Tax=Demequina sp. TaxID=2050685 RepID=UPI0025DF8442|nr:Ig-like domain-containing protein [Demequina sp.]
MTDVGRATAARRRRAGRIVTGVLLAAVAVGVVVAPGVDEREADTVDPSVWALQTGSGQRFARVNTAIAEVDTVKAVDSPSEIVQYRDRLLVLSASYTSVTALDSGRPTDVAAGGAGSTATPAGTTAVAAAGDVVAYLADDGDVLVGRISDGTATSPREVTLDSGTGLRALAVTVTAAGDVAAYSPAAGGVIRASADGSIRGIDEVPGGPAEGSFQVTFAAGAWALLDADTGQLWRAGAEAALASGTGADARLQRPTSDGAVRIADGEGLVIAPADGTTPRREFGSGVAIGTPAAPAELDGVMFAAWLPAGEGQGTLWSSTGPTVSLDYAGQALGQRREPVLRGNGSRMVLNEARSGWVWDVPGGELVRSSQDWVPEDQTASEAEQDEVATEVREPRPPVAEADAFGVRAGRQVRLPVLLNDHDANGDLLTIDPASLTAPDPAFADVGIGDDGQSLVATVRPGATGTATLGYAVTDGTALGGLRSDVATVTLTVSEGDASPEWCGVEGCVVEWPAPQIRPGGTVAVDVLEGWVDPDGDPLYVVGANSADPGVSVAASPEGTVVVRDRGDSPSIAVDVVVSDSTGARAERTLTVGVVGSPRLRVEPVAVTALQGVRAAIDIAGRVTGAAGVPAVTEASVDPPDGASVEVEPDGTGVLFRADAPGTYLVDVTVVDGAAQTRGRARVTVLAPEDEALATVPLTAFVRPHEDVTVDVLGAVTNPGGRVLLLAEASVDPEPGARVAATIVGHGALRLSGTTADGQAGTLGVVSFTVTDGSGRAPMTVRGEVTVVLLDAAVPAPPLAGDDAITVRAGGQVDVRVLDNDIAAAGSVVALDAGSVAAPADGGLAFPAGPVLRYLAPETPGTYRIPYASYVLGFPAQRDTAALVVTVTSGDDNAPPAPRDLAGRASSGEEVRLPFDGAGLDPDGDSVSLDAVTRQPSDGAARISADGSALVYNSTAGYAGQDSFEFQVIDGRGRTATATARIGVVGSDADPAPVTYTDFVQVQAASGRRVLVQPLANDLDLTGGELELLDVRPDAATGTAEHAALAALMPAAENTADALARGLVTFEVQGDVGTYSFLYTARNSTGSISQGRIVLKAVRETVVDVPIVADTVLTLETRDVFTTGVDVLDGTVAWASGDAGALTVSLWGDPADLTLAGSRISGPLPEHTRIVPFRVEGVDFAGATTVGYGFLRVIGEQELRLALREDARLEVAEGADTTVNVASLLAAPEGTDIELDAAQVRAGGAREQASCGAAGGTRVRYDAGAGSPYSDTCLVAVRLPGQRAWTVLPIPVDVIPTDPVPRLVSASLEIAPGESATFELGRLVRWPAGASSRPVDLASSYTGQLFVVARTGTRVTITARDDAAPGRTESVTVSLPDHPEVRPKALALVVGPAPEELPKGGSVVQRCSQASGDGCTITVIGVAGEVNPLPGTPLEVVAVTGADACPSVKFAVTGTRAVRATWADDAPGGVCDAVFSVRDAQGRVSAADRSGSISLDLQGFPAAPARVAQVAYGDGTLTLAVDPGAAAGAYPALTGFDVLAGSARVATCTASGVCTPLEGLVNGAKATYTAYAVNSVGRSQDGASVTAWSYAPPEAPRLVSWEPTVTSGDGRRIDMVVEVPDPSTRELRVSAGESVQVVAVGVGSQRLEAVSIGSNTPVEVTLTPLTGIELPPVEGAAAAGAAIVFTANGIGRPAIAATSHEYAEGASTATVTATVTDGGAGSTTWVGAAVSGPCRPDTPAVGGAASFTVPVTKNAVNTVAVCAESRAEGRVYGQAPAVDVVFAAFSDPGAPVLQRGYRVASTCEGTGTSCTTALEREPQWQPQRGMEVWYRGSDGSESAKFTDILVAGRAVDIVAYLCVDFGGGNRSCSEQTAPVTPESGAEYRPTVSFASCTVGTVPEPTLGGVASDFAVVVTMLDGAGAPTTDAALMRSATTVVTFKGALTGIAPWSSPAVVCGGAPDPSSDASVSP